MSTRFFVVDRAGGLFFSDMAAIASWISRRDGARGGVGEGGIALAAAQSEAGKLERREVPSARGANGMQIMKPWVGVERELRVV